MKTKLLLAALLLASLAKAQDGTLDLTFNSAGSGATLTPRILDVDASGKILVEFDGIGNTYNDTAIKNLAKLNADGTVDASFTQYDIAGSQTQYIGSAKNLSNSNIVFSQVERTRSCSDFYSCTFIASLQLKRMDSAGNLDPFFSNNALSLYVYGMGTTIAPEYEYRSVVEHFNDKVVAGGYFTNYSGSGTQKYSYIVRFDEDGSLDYSFNPGGTGPNGSVNQIVKDTYNNLFIVGDFTMYNDLTATGIAKLKSDGTLDANFNKDGSGFNDKVKTVAIQQDGKILVGGIFTTYNGTAVNNIVRLNLDGSLDTTFSSLSFESATGGPVDITKLIVLSDGKILFSGRFNKYNLVQTGSVGRLNSDGTLDTTFNTGGRGAKVLNSGVVSNALLSNIATLPDGKILFTGDFNYYNNNGTKKLFYRLIGATPQVFLGTSDLKNKSTAQIYPNPSTGIFKIKNNQKIESVEIYDASGRLLKRQAANAAEIEVNISGNKPGLYLIKTNSGNTQNTQKLILK